MKKVTKKSRVKHMDDAEIAKFYDSQSEEEILAELEAATRSPDTVLMPVPRSLVPEVFKLLDKKKKTA